MLWTIGLLRDQAANAPRSAADRGGCGVAHAERFGRVARAHWSSGGAARYASKSGFATLRAAQRYADGRKASGRLRPGLRVEPGLSVGEWWLRWFRRRVWRRRPWRATRSTYRRNVHPCFGERELSEITGPDLVGFARGLRAQRLAAVPRCFRSPRPRPTLSGCCWYHRSWRRSSPQSSSGSGPETPRCRRCPPTTSSSRPGARPCRSSSSAGSAPRIDP